ncbi:MAG: TraM recognition domain-containing protein, partial [Dehalococcoidia bacterium]|nr:TraM recognition domain-containing protein [Dehalococcoidia bacterium]
SALHGGEAWRTLLQTLRTKLFLSLSDESSSKIASDLCGTVPRMKASFSFSENTGRAGVSLLSARTGGAQGSLGTSKSYREQREPLFHPRDFSLLSNCQAICLPYDGIQSLPARRVYLKPYYLPKEAPYWELHRDGQL